MTQSAPVARPEAAPVAGTYRIDASHTGVEFSVRHLGLSKVRGRFSGVEGTIHIADDPAASSVTASIDATTVDTRDAQRDTHLRSADFFDVERHPTLDFRSTRVREDGDEWLVDGDLTIHGVTRPVTLTVTYEGTAGDPWGGTRAAFSAVAEIDREEYGLTWNQALEAGGWLVGRRIRIELDIQAVLEA